MMHAFPDIALPATTDRHSMPSDPTKKAELDNIQANIGKLMAETMKLHAEAAKMRRERDWHPFVAGAGMALAIIGLIKLFMP
jgi:hypothetical protein